MKNKENIKSKRLNICLTDYEYSFLDAIRENHNKSISQLIRDSLIFYGIYYPIPLKNIDTDNS
jgi:hypothetical protein